MLSNLCWPCLLLGGLLAADTVSAVNLTPNPQQYFDESMGFLDLIYDKSASYLNYFYLPIGTGQHETRSSIWYAAGLLQRNDADDVHEAVKIIKNIIGDQYKNVSQQWYGDYTIYPEQPTVDTEWYPKSSIFNTWDPNWRGFIGTTLIIIYEEFQQLLPLDVQDLILESMYNNTVGDSYRVGGVDDDILYPSYSNPWLMRAIATGWTGRKWNDTNMTVSGETYANQALDLFNINNTLSEFNSPTYAAVSIYALTMWAKYMPPDSVMGQNGARMIREIWDTTAALYNPVLNNLAGPWDRAYGFDMNKYVGLMSVWVWSLLGKEQAFRSRNVWSLNHADDFEYAPVFAVLAPFHDSLIPPSTISKLGSTKEQMVHVSTYSPPHDLALRNITVWMSRNVTIGAQSYVETAVGGPREDSTQWNPAVVQWSRSDGSVGYLTFHPTENALDVVVAPNWLNMTLPQGNSSSAFTFLVSSNPLGGKRDILKVSDIEGINIKVAGNINSQPEIGFCGILGGTCNVIHDFDTWNLTFTIEADSTELPFISIFAEQA